MPYRTRPPNWLVLCAALTCAAAPAQTGLAELRAAFASTDDPESAFSRRAEAVAKLGLVENAVSARELLAAWQRVHLELRAVERERGTPARNLLPSVTEMRERAILDAGLRLCAQIEPALAHATSEGRAPVIDALFQGRTPIQLRAALAPSAARLGCDPARAHDALAQAQRPDDTWVALRAIRALGRRGGDCHDQLLRCLDDPVAPVRAEAMRTIVALADRAAAPALIARFGKELGRMREAVGSTLEQLTGQSLGTGESSWRAWWDAEGEAFVRHEVGKPRNKRRPAHGATESGYFGIPQDGRSILYVVDASLSMRARMGRNDARSRWDACVAELEAAIDDLGPERSFDIVAFAQRVRSWRGRPVRADVTQVAAAKKWIEALDLELGTAAFEGIEVATTIAGPSIEDRYFEPAVDTLFFLSDGQPTVRRADQPRSLDADDPDLIDRLLDRRDPLHSIQVNTVMLGRGGTAFMRRLAADHGGRFVAR